jgi:dihydrofolate synthase / folylpolyglutamate synthase
MLNGTLNPEHRPLTPAGPMEEPASGGPLAVKEPADIHRALAALFERTTRGIKPGLERMEALLDRLGRPERALPVIHVAGTNGKGSVCATIESLLRAAGLRTGLYTSPHLVRFHERIRVDGVPVSDADLAGLIGRMDAADRAAGGTATFFECATAMAFDQFARAGVQVAVIETGMGGRWDATNVVRPIVCALCEVNLDHAEYLGDTLELIAAEKAGILKPGRPAVMARQPPEAEAVFRAAADRVGAPLRRVEDEVSVRRIGRPTLDGQRLAFETPDGPLTTARYPLCGEHQAHNAALAVAAVRLLSETAGIGLPAAVWKRGLERVVWPARFQVLRREPPVLLDGAHNPHGAEALAAALREVAGRRPLGWIVAMMNDKDIAGVLRAWTPLMRRVWAVPVPGERAEPPARMIERLGAAGIRDATSAPLDRAWDEALAWAEADDGMVVIAGSLYLAGEVLRRRGDGERLFLA